MCSVSLWSGGEQSPSHPSAAEGLCHEAMLDFMGSVIPTASLHNSQPAGPNASLNSVSHSNRQLRAHCTRPTASHEATLVCKIFKIIIHLNIIKVLHTCLMTRSRPISYYTWASENQQPIRATMWDKRE